MEIEVRLTNQQIKRGLKMKEGKFLIEVDRHQIIKTLFKEHKELFNVPKKYLKYLSSCRMMFLDFDTKDTGLVIYRKGKHDGTDFKKLGYFLIKKPIKEVKKNVRRKRTNRNAT